MRNNLKAIIGLTIVATLLVVGVFIMPRYTSALKSDVNTVSSGALWVDAVWPSNDFLKDTGMGDYINKYPDTVPLLIGLNTHVGDISNYISPPDEDVGYTYDIDGKELGSKVRLIDTNGNEYPPVVEPIMLSGHHNTYLMFFPRVDTDGDSIFTAEKGTVTVVFQGLAGIPELRLNWVLPLAVKTGETRDLANWLMLALALVGAIMVTLSPCALDLTAYYTGIITAVVGEEVKQSSNELAKPQRQVITRNMVAFALGFTTLYSVAGGTIAFVGSKGLTRIPFEHSLEVIGGSLIALFALNMVGMFDQRYLQSVKKPLWLLQRKVSAWLSGRFASPHLTRVESGEPEHHRVNVTNSYLAGIGLSMTCLTCMGGGILIPLLIYAGIADWYWGVITLASFSAAIAFPMIIIARSSFGFFTKRLKWSRRLRYVSFAILMTVAVLLISGNHQAITDAILGMFYRILG